MKGGRNILLVDNADVSAVATNIKYQSNWTDGASTFTFEYPCVSLRAYDIAIGGAKNVDISEVSVEIGIYSKYKGVEEIAGVLNDVENVLTNASIDLSADHYAVISTDIAGKARIDVIADTNSPVKYAATLTFAAKIQYIGG